MNGNVEALEQIKEQLEKEKQKVQEIEKQTLILTNATIEGIAVHDHGVLKFANQSFYDMFRYEPEELIEKNLITDIETVAEDSIETVQSHIVAGNEDPYIVNLIRKDGTKFRAVVTGKVIPYAGETMRGTIFLALNDIPM